MYCRNDCGNYAAQSLICSSCWEKISENRVGQEMAGKVDVGKVEQHTTAVESDGGSTSYYELTLPKHVLDSVKRQIEGCCEDIKIETGDVIEMLVGNDFDAGNIIKALRRIFEAKKGRGKDGVDPKYDLNKCHYFIDEVEKKL